MKSLKKERAAFTEAGAALRHNRNEDTASSYDWLLGNPGLREDRLDYLAHEMIRHGHYATPSGYSKNNPRSYQSVRHGIMSHMFREWRRRSPEMVVTRKTRFELWSKFCRAHGYDALTSSFR